ncbi:metal-dependent hydrolase [Paracidovorax citrulli]
MKSLRPVLLAALAAASVLQLGCATSDDTGGSSTSASASGSAPARLAPRAAPGVTGNTQVLWLGQAAVRITSPGGKVIVIDPWLSGNPKTPAAFKPLTAIGKVDLILVTHAHGDHLGDAPALAKMHNVPIYNGGGMGRSLVTLGMVPEKLSQRFNKGSMVTPFGPDAVRIVAVHAEHSSELAWKNPATGQEETHYGGEPVGYIIELENGFRIWHMGDTAMFADMRLIGELYRPDLVLIPIGGHFTMGPEEAALAVRELIRPRFAIPIHYQTSPQLRGTPAEFEAALGRGAATQVVVPQPGETVGF